MTTSAPRGLARRSVLGGALGAAAVAGLPPRAQAASPAALPSVAPSSTGPAAATVPAAAAVGPLDSASLFTPTYVGAGTVFTRSVVEMPTAPNSAAIAGYLPSMPAAYQGFGVVTSTNTNHYAIPIYVVDSRDPAQPTAVFRTTVPTGSPLWSMLNGRIPCPANAVVDAIGDHSMAIYDRGTGIMRELFFCTKQVDGSWDVAWGGYYQAAADLAGLATSNYPMQLTAGSSAVVGMLSSLAQVSIAEARAGAVNHAVCFTAANALANVASWPARQQDGTDTNPNAPAQGQWFRIPPSVDLAALNLRPFTLLIARAAQRFGGFAADKNLWCHAFNCEPGYAEQLRTGQNPWAAGGDLNARYGGENPDVNDFPWHLTEWAPLDWGMPRPPAEAGTVVAGSIVPLGPARVLDTRSGLGSPAKVAAGGTATVTVLGRGGVPASGVSAVLLNVTVIEPEAGGHVTCYPAGSGEPVASNLNFVTGQSVATLVHATVGSGGAIALANNSIGATHLVADVAAYVVGGVARFPGATVPLAPARVLDTRAGVGAPQGAVRSGGQVVLTIGGRAGVPEGAAAVVLTLTATQPQTVGYLTAFPDGARWPLASTVNFTSGRSVPNLAVVPLGAGGRIRIGNGSGGNVHVVADIAGWIVGGLATEPGTFTAATPTRVLDTRTGVGATGQPVAANASVRLVLGGVGAVPAAARGVLLNVTATAVEQPGYLTVHPSGSAIPDSSTLNIVPGEATANLVLALLGADGAVLIENRSSGTCHLLADLAGWYR
ncbi:MAG TPA: hypothetical protein P5181_05245 [Dermatophilaceae bacterium]|nr:hypothetical protein [Dermatophilaceae bacterium]